MSKKSSTFAPQNKNRHNEKKIIRIDDALRPGAMFACSGCAGA